MEYAFSRGGVPTGLRTAPATTKGSSSSSSSSGEYHYTGGFRSHFAWDFAAFDQM